MCGPRARPVPSRRLEAPGCASAGGLMKVAKTAVPAGGARSGSGRSAAGRTRGGHHLRQAEEAADGHEEDQVPRSERPGEQRAEDDPTTLRGAARGPPGGKPTKRVRALHHHESSELPIRVVTEGLAWALRRGAPHPVRRRRLRRRDSDDHDNGGAATTATAGEPRQWGDVRRPRPRENKNAKKSHLRDLNPGPADYESAALPAELRWHDDALLGGRGSR